MFRFDKLTDSFRSKIALNIKTKKRIIIEDELRSACFLLVDKSSYVLTL